ncbi:hypothetical protein [Spirulina major]|uniref:hypothetical protein n=1 Tax=Spirulina major TaxID=270636 RepID=UPI001114B8F3|nr:hypothetical protein [Spirulina major]
MSSYWAWLARMALFGLIGSASVGFFLRTELQTQPQAGNGARSPQAQVVPFDPEYLLPSDAIASGQYRPASDRNGSDRNATHRPNLPPIPNSRLAPPPTYENYAAIPDLPLTAAATSPTPPPPANRDYETIAPTPQPEQRFNLSQSIVRHSRLFEKPISLGMLAIGKAEGNYRVFVEANKLYVEQTPLYFGHTDPGNLSWGERVTNYGPCSDQGRSGGNIATAEQMCSQRAVDRLPTNLQDLYNAGINPDEDIEAVINTADLYNQASPVHSRVFPQALIMAYQGGLQGVEAMAWARTASFYLNGNNALDLRGGQNRASGLLGICARERRPVTEWECVYGDQLRRSKAIASVLEQYFQVYGS